MRERDWWVLTVVGLTIVVASVVGLTLPSGVTAAPSRRHLPSPDDSTGAAQSRKPPVTDPTIDAARKRPTLRAPRATIPVPGGTTMFGWSFLDRRTGRRAGSPDAESTRNTVESMIKAGIAGDYLRRLAESGQRPSRDILNELTLMIVDSHDGIAEKYYRRGGGDAVITRLIARCGLRSVRLRSGWWSLTAVTPADSVRYGLCVADGRAAGLTWTPWLLSTMRKVRGGVDDQVSTAKQGGRWGVISGLPAELAARVAIKNGWTLHAGTGWHVNCLAIHPDWILVVQLRTGRSLDRSAAMCADVARALLVWESPAAT